MATYYLRPTNGNDGNDGLSFANAKLTMQAALDLLTTAGDILRMVPEATETTAAAVDLDAGAGNDASPIIIEPGNTTDGGRDLSLTYTLQASGAIAAVIAQAAGADFIEIFGLVLDGNSNATNCMTMADGVISCVYNTCRFTGATGDGLATTNQGRNHFVLCEFDNNGGDGAAGTAANRGNNVYDACSFHDNTSHGLSGSHGSLEAYQCECYDNGVDGMNLDCRNGQVILKNNTSFGNTGDGFALTLQPAVTIVGNSSSGNTGIGFSVDAGEDYLYMDYNHTHNNSGGATDITAGMPGENNQTGDPQFASVVDGSEDFTPANGSPLDSNGLLGVDIGARKAADPAGGAGLLVHPGMSGGARG